MDAYHNSCVLYSLGPWPRIVSTVQCTRTGVVLHFYSVITIRYQVVDKNQKHGTIHVWGSRSKSVELRGKGGMAGLNGSHSIQKSASTHPRRRGCSKDEMNI